MAHLLQPSEIRKNHARRAGFHVVERLAAHRCEMGLYVAESGRVAEDEYDADVWIAWDGVGPLGTCDRVGTPRPVPALDRP